jgi:hypothetical protein
VRPHVGRFRPDLTGRGVLRRFAGLIAIAAMGIVVAGCNSQEGTAFDDQNYSPTSGGAFDSTTLKTTDARSLFVGSNYRKAFKLAERKLGAGAQIDAAELHPGQLALTVISHGKQLSVAVQYNGEYGSKPGGALAGTPTTFRLARLAGDTPATLARRISSETHFSIAQLKSMIVTRIPGAGGLYWMVYTPNPTVYFTAASAHGPIEEQRASSEPIRLR